MNIPFKIDTLSNGVKIVYIPRKDNNITSTEKKNGIPDT